MASQAVKRDAPEPSAAANVGGLLAGDYIAVQIIGLASRLNREASAFYRSGWDISMAEWRLLLVLRRTGALNISELAEQADIDKAAASRSLKLLQDRGLIDVEMTRSRGRAAITRLTQRGHDLAETLKEHGDDRQERLFEAFSPADMRQLSLLLTAVAKELPPVERKAVRDFSMSDSA